MILETNDLPPISEVISEHLTSPPDNEIWSRSNYNVNILADLIISKLTNGQQYIDVASIGAGALNQAIKAVAIARDRMLGAGQDLILVPYWSVIKPHYDKTNECTRVMIRVFRVK